MRTTKITFAVFWELLVFLAAGLCSCKIILYVYSDLETEGGVGETEEGHKSITETGTQQEKVVVCSDPHLDSRDSTEEQTPVAGVSGNHKASMHESWSQKYLTLLQDSVAEHISGAQTYFMYRIKCNCTVNNFECLRTAVFSSLVLTFLLARYQIAKVLCYGIGTVEVV